MTRSRTVQLRGVRFTVMASTEGVMFGFGWAHDRGEHIMGVVVGPFLIAIEWQARRRRLLERE